MIQISDGSKIRGNLIDTGDFLDFKIPLTQTKQVEDHEAQEFVERRRTRAGGTQFREGIIVDSLSYLAFPGRLPAFLKSFLLSDDDLCDKEYLILAFFLGCTNSRLV